MSTVFWDNSVHEKTGVPIEAPGYAGPNYLQNEWDTCTIQNNQLPGRIEVFVQSKKRRLQNKKHNGSDGSTPTFRGLDPAIISIRVVLWTPSQLLRWDTLLAILFPNPNRDINKLSALDISHPATLQRGIRAIIIEDIEGPVNGQVTGSKEYFLRCIEYIPVSPKKSSTKTIHKAAATTPQFADNKTHNKPDPPSKREMGPLPARTPQGGSS